MPQRKVFGKRSNARHDTFAPMLRSSPDTKIVEVLLEQASIARTNMPPAGPHTSPKQKQLPVLQDLNVNAAAGRTKAKHSGRPTRSSRKSRIEVPCYDTQAQSDTTNALPSGPVGRRSPLILTTRDHVNRRLGDKLESTTKQAHNELKDVAADCPYSTHCAPLLSLFQQELESFSDWTAQLTEHLTVIKIAEASYGEVYRLSHEASCKDQALVSGHEESVLKIIALTPPDSLLPNSKRERSKALKKAAYMSKPADAASEVRLLQRMSNIPGFTDFRELRVLKGRPTAAFIHAYRSFNKAQQENGNDPSTFPDPSKRSSYPTDQLWAVIEMRDAGTDLERLVEQGLCQDIWAVWDIFWQVALALAKGEEGAEFEHRDLHMGNICVRGRAVPDKHSCLDKRKRLGFTQLDATLIDYTISRATMSTDQEKPDTAYLDLSKDQFIFNADSSQEYQYDIYRYMRSALFADDALAALAIEELPDTESRDWSQYHPQTNVVWLHFVLYTLLDQMHYSRSTKAPAKKHKDDYAIWRRAKTLENTLDRVNDLLDPRHVIKNGVVSASFLIATALSEGWLDLEDVVGSDASVVVDDLVDTLTRMELGDLQAA